MEDLPQQPTCAAAGGAAGTGTHRGCSPALKRKAGVPAPDKLEISPRICLADARLPIGADKKGA
jgi:hypothetical protein